MRRFLTIDEFRGRVAGADGQAAPAVWRAAPSNPSPDSNGRIIRYELSDPSVARDGHTIAAGAWVLDNYLRNPVFLWAHDSAQPPIGRMVEIGRVGDRLMGNVEYPERDAYPFADTIYQLVKGGYLNAVSVSWMPLEWSFTQDRTRPGGIDFSRVELLEVSQVPVPALPTALVAARAAGIDTGPVFDWAEQLLDQGDRVLVPRAELETLRRAAKMPKPTQQRAGNPALPNGSTAAGATEPPVVERSAAYGARILTMLRTIQGAAIPASKGQQRGLWLCAYLLMVLDDLYSIVDSARYEAAAEGDNSPVPAMLEEAAALVGRVAMAMTAEEIGEEAAGDDDDDEAAVDVGYMAAAPGAQRQAALRLAARSLRPGFARAGRVLSGDNEAALRDAHEHLNQACELVRGVYDQVEAAPAGDDDAAAAREWDEKLQRARELKTTT
jgi:HK97 family phage prohead protease